MSYTAIWRNRNKHRKCTSDKACCGVMIPHGQIPAGMVVYHTFMLIKNPDGRKNKYGGRFDSYHLDTPEYGRIMTQEQADELDMETGRSVPSFRNGVKFVQSRAARKHGYKSTDYFYNNSLKRREWEESQLVK